MIFVNNNSRHSSEKTRFTLQACVPYLIRKQMMNGATAQYELNTSIFDMSNQVKNSKHLCVSYQFTMRKENYEQDTSIT